MVLQQAFHNDLSLGQADGGWDRASKHTPTTS